MHLLIIGILLGWGAAIPIGPINLEIVRRNLRYSTAHGVCLGLGACSADVIYLVLLCLGTLTLLKHPTILHSIGIAGALILGWFGINALRMQVIELIEKENRGPLIQHYVEGLLLTLFNPFTILFWSSVSTQITTMAVEQHAILYAGSGVLIGTLSWSLSLNILLHITKHRISNKIIHRLNIVGGIILLGFAIFGLWHNIFATMFLK